MLNNLKVNKMKNLEKITNKMTRKPWDYSDIDSVIDVDEKNYQFQNWINDLPVLETLRDLNEIDELITDYKNQKNPTHHISSEQQYFVLKTIKDSWNKYYLIDTQGYNYPRYVSELINN